jgi:hypothetical protein
MSIFDSAQVTGGVNEVKSKQVSDEESVIISCLAEVTLSSPSSPLPIGRPSLHHEHHQGIYDRQSGKSEMEVGHFLNNLWLFAHIFLLRESQTAQSRM